MSRRTTKAIVKRGAVVAAAGLGAGALAPLAAMVADRAFDAVSRSRRRRVESLLAHALRGDDAEELAARLNQAFLDEEPEVLTHFHQAVRAAADAVDPAVIPSIGLLYRRAVTPSLTPLPLWQVRRYLGTLEELTAQEFGDLRTFIHAVLGLPRRMGEPGREGVPLRASGSDIVTALVGADQYRVCAVQGAPRVLQILTDHRLAEPPTEFGEGVMVGFDLLRPLAAVMPLPDGPNDVEAVAPQTDAEVNVL